MRERDDRSVRAFLLAIRAVPGFGLRVASMVAFASALAWSKGLRTMTEALLLGVVLCFVVGYPLFRRRGKVS